MTIKMNQLLLVELDVMVRNVEMDLTFKKQTADLISKNQQAQRI